MSSIEPVIERDLRGTILAWNRAAERSYGWSKEQALGSVSHNLFNTIFPVALDEINSQLMQAGSWEGELIHVLSDGTRVRVLSSWTLLTEEGAEPAGVVETNSGFEPLAPESAHFSEPSLVHRLVSLMRDKRAWLVLVLILIVILEIVVIFRDEIPRPPVF